MPQATLLLIEPDERTASFMKHMLARAGYEVQVAPTGKEGLINAWRDLPDAIVLELNLPDLDGLDVVRRLRSDHRTQKTIIVSLTTRSLPEDNIAGIKAGLDEYIVKQTDAVDILLRYLTDEARTALRVSDTSSTPQQGHLIAFLGTKGGVGTSSLCLNVACQLTRLASNPLLVVLDLVLPIGSLVQITGADPSIDIVRLTKLDSSELTSEFLRRNLPKPNPWGFYLIPGATDPKQASNLLEERLTPAIQTLRTTFNYVIVDVGRTLSRLSMIVLKRADILVMVLTPDEVGIHNTLTVMNYLEQEGIPKDRMLPVSNRPLPTEGFGEVSVEHALGLRIGAAIPYMGTCFQLANSLHTPLYVRFPDESTTQSVETFSTTLLQQLEEDRG